MTTLTKLVTIAAVLMTWTSAGAQTIVTSFAPAYVIDGQWFENDVRDAGAASIVDLTGLGGDLENNQPIPIGATLLTTGLLNNNDKADVAVQNNYGLASSVLTSVQLGYSYYKATVAGGNASAAPTMKLALFAPGGTGDNFGQLIYEPTWNQPGGGSQVAPADAWQTVLIDQNTGGGDGDASGGWWWTGGFEIGSGAGGPPLRSLAEWAAAFQAADPVDFPNAVVFQVAMGVGTYNLGQIGYFDQVSILNTLADATYNFEPQGTVAVEHTTWSGIKDLYR